MFTIQVVHMYYYRRNTKQKQAVIRTGTLVSHEQSGP